MSMIITKYKLNVPLALFAGLIFATLFSCSWPGSYLQHNWTVESRFDGHEIFTDYQYYTGGTLDDPRGIIALKPEFTLESSDWQPVDITPEVLARWIEALHKDFFVSYNSFPNGAEVVGNNGDVVGFYYSVWEFPLVRMPDKKSLLIAVPDAEYRTTNKRVEFFTGDDVWDDH